MKLFAPRAGQKGVCFVCGKPTKLLIHTPCGQKVDADKNTKTGPLGLSKQQQENGRHNQSKRRYAAGNVPPWAKT